MEGGSRGWVSAEGVNYILCVCISEGKALV